MSSVVISGDTSGAITLSAPAVAGTNTATLPAATGTVMVSGNMPAFSAYKSTDQTGVASGTFTKVLYDTEEFDTNSCYSSSRFTPNVAGYYQVTARTDWSITSGACFMAIYKNGSIFKSGALNGATSSGTGPIVTALISCNGSTDYIEIYAYQNNGTNTIFSSSAGTYFQASMVRGA